MNAGPSRTHNTLAGDVFDQLPYARHTLELYGRKMGTSSVDLSTQVLWLPCKSSADVMEHMQAQMLGEYAAARRRPRKRLAEC